MTGDTERRIEACAARQGGHLTREQLTAAGLHRSSIYRQSEAGRLVRVGRRTYRLGSVPRSATGDVLAVCLDTGGVASHWTAAWLHGLAAPPQRVEVTVRRAAAMYEPRLVGAEQARARVHSSTNLPLDDVTSIGAIPVTSVARTALALAAFVPQELELGGLARIVDRAVDAGSATDAWLWQVLTDRRCRGRNGVIALESVLAQRAGLGPTESWLEREVLRILAASGLPRPETQRVIRRRGRFVARVDFVFEAQRVVLEAMGYAHHRTRAELEADTRRANELQLLGYAVYQFTTTQVVGSPDSIVATVRRALEPRTLVDQPA